MGRVAADHPPGSTMTFLGVVVFRDNQNTVFFPTAPENRDYLRRGGTCPAAGLLRPVADGGG